MNTDEKENLTLFHKEGYTKTTGFKVLIDRRDLKKDDIVTLYDDDGSHWPWFITEDGRVESLRLPGWDSGDSEELEVYDENWGNLTPFQRAGYTKDTKFRVLKDWLGFKKGDTVTMYSDDGDTFIEFTRDDGKTRELPLPGMSPPGDEEWLELY